MNDVTQNKTYVFPNNSEHFLCIKQIDFILPCIYTVIDHCYSSIYCYSYFHAMTSSVLYFARQNEIYLLNIETIDFRVHTKQFKA